MSKLKCENCNKEIDTEKQDVSALIVAQDNTEYCAVGIYCEVGCMEIAHYAHTEKIIRDTRIHIKTYTKTNLLHLLKEIDRLWRTKFDKFKFTKHR